MDSRLGAYQMEQCLLRELPRTYLTYLTYLTYVTDLGHKHKAPDYNHEATQPMVDLPHTS